MSSNLKLIRRRIKTAKNIGQITKAMEMVAASKMKKAQKKAREAKPYSQIILEITHSLVQDNSHRLHPLLKIPDIDDKPLVVLISTNRGLCGSLNLNLFRKLAGFVGQKKQDKTTAFHFAVLGKKGVAFVFALEGGFFADFSDIVPFTEAVGPITEIAIEYFINGKNTSVWLAYSDFINALKQEPIIKRILPITELTPPLKQNKIASQSVDYLVEPSAKEVIDQLLPYYLEIQIREAIFEAEASEYSARMIAMKNATENALGLMDGLTLEYNKARQQAITTEIADIITSKISMGEK